MIQMKGTLYIVATPIGNIQDISARAIDVLQKVDAIACEDTRHTGKLLSILGIKNKLISYHEHNESQRSVELLKRLQSGDSIALVSDAGTPGISDPGFAVIKSARDAGLDITVVPGPVAFASAVAISGLPTDSIYFGGFLPARTSARKKLLREFADLRATLVFYESPRRLAASLLDCLSVFGARKAVVVRELTKIHEETVCGDLSELAQRYEDETVKGEIVLIIDREKAPVTDEDSDPEMRLLELISQFEGEGLERKSALKKAAKECGYSKPEAYRIVENHKT